MSQTQRKFSPEFRRAAVERMRDCENIAQLARELGIPRKYLYRWKPAVLRAEGAPPGSGRTEQEWAVVRQLRAKVEQLEKVVVRQSLELDFFKGALQLVEERRRQSGLSTGPRCTSGSGQSKGGKAN